MVGNYPAGVTEADINEAFGDDDRDRRHMSSDRDSVNWWAQHIHDAGRGDNFACLLVRLIMKADGDNKSRLRKGFPAAVDAVDRWRSAPNEVEWFREQGVRTR